MKKAIILLVIMALSASSLTYAQDDSNTDTGFSKWQFRLRGIVVTPDESATIQGIGGK